MRSKPRKAKASVLALKQKLLRAKGLRRRALARLPIEDKLRMLVAMQRLAEETQRALGRAARPAWRLQDGL